MTCFTIEVGVFIKKKKRTLHEVNTNDIFIFYETQIYGIFFSILNERKRRKKNVRNSLHILCSVRSLIKLIILRNFNVIMRWKTCDNQPTLIFFECKVNAFQWKRGYNFLYSFRSSTNDEPLSRQRNCWKQKVLIIFFLHYFCNYFSFFAWNWIQSVVEIRIASTDIEVLFFTSFQSKWNKFQCIKSINCSVPKFQPIVALRLSSQTERPIQNDGRNGIQTTRCK